MRPFAYYRPANSEALEAILVEAPRDVPPTAAKAQFIAGGTTILDLMKLDVARPEVLIGIDQLEILLRSNRVHTACASERWREWMTFPIIPPLCASIR